mmetsp:Transcript_14555/g.32439  ORF Transcript_14555/g.32439 Transcript_14555/m.32439 type:complete len:293 (+) Transcript_14555:234-1112(+)
MRSILDTVKSRYDRTISERTQRLDPDVRRELADEVESALNVDGEGGGSGGDGAADRPSADDIDAATAEIDDAIIASRKKLEELERSEQFVGVRCRRYRLALQDRAAELERLTGAAAGGEDTLPSNEEQEDVEGGGESASQYPNCHPVMSPRSTEELAEMQRKQAADEAALGKVVDTHRTMLANVESMRRKIADLEVKREEILAGREMCRDFLLAAAEAEELEAEGELQRGACPLTPSVGRPGATDSASASAASSASASASAEGRGYDNETLNTDTTQSEISETGSDAAAPTR